MLINNIRSEDVLRPQTREYSNAVHIIETPFADDGYSMPNMADMPAGPMSDTPYMGGGMPVNPNPMPAEAAGSDIPDGFAQPVSAPVSGQPVDFGTDNFEMAIKKESSVSSAKQTPDFGQPMIDGFEGTPSFGSPTAGQEFSNQGIDGGFSVNIPENAGFDSMNSAMPTPEPSLRPDANEQKGGTGFFKKKKNK